MSDCINRECSAKKDGVCLNDFPSVKCYGYEPPRITNADRLRAMNDEELAEWIERIRIFCANEFCGRACPLHDVCFSFAEQPAETLYWLKQEANEEKPL